MGIPSRLSLQLATNDRVTGQDFEMRPLFSGSLASARTLSETQFVVALSVPFERFLLAMLVVGLLFVGVAMAQLLDGREIAWEWILPGISLLSWSIYSLFLPTRLLFDRRGGTFWLMRPFRKTKEWRIEDIQKVVLRREFDIAELELMLKNDERVLIARTDWSHSELLAEPVAAFLGIAIERENLT
jgi:hypothetical protein